MSTAAASRQEYTGFWIRVWATVIDAFLWAILAYPVLLAVHGWEYLDSEAMVQGPVDFLISWVLPTIVVIVFWIYRLATPGKMAISARIVDAKTGERPSNAQLIGRYFAYWVSALPLGIGFIWAAFDRRKQGWHDKLAGTVVVREVIGPAPVAFETQQAHL
jgi:uncharacterized RDD family membrane protein YckC